MRLLLPIRVSSSSLFLAFVTVALALVGFSSPATSQAPHGRIEATGTVGFNSLASGVFAGIPAGTPVEMRVDIALPGIPLSPGQYEVYTIQTATSYLKVGASTITFKPGGEPFGLTNNFPVADGVHLFATGMSPTYFMEFELFDGSGGNVFGSPDYESEAGYYGPEPFQAIDWNVLGAGQMGITLQGFVLHPVSTSGTLLLAGPGVPGQAGKTPLFTAAGALVAGQPVSFTLSDAAPSAPLWWVVGASALNAPFKGGVMVPNPDLLLLGLSTNLAGGLGLAGNWPPGIPSGFALWMQIWISDPAGPVGFSASNGLKAIAF